MTFKQRIYFLWLTVHNALRIIERCPDSQRGRDIIDSAYQKRRALGLPYVDGMGTRRMIRDLRRIVAQAETTRQGDEANPFDPF